MTESTLPQLPLDENEWSDIRRRQLFFVDKTARLSELVDYAHAVFLSRPHGMGKTWLCSQLYELFSKGPTACDGLNVARTWPERERYPVINFSFNAVPANYQTMEQSLKDALAVAYGIAGFFEVYDWAQEPLSLNQFLTKLTTISQQQRLVFLLDDWDHPLNSSLGHKWLFDSALALLRQFYSWLLSLPQVRFILVTGIMPFEMGSLVMGSAMRNISHEPRWADLLGITPQELACCYAPYLQAIEGEVEKELAASYLGFCFDWSDQVKLYSPQSLNLHWARRLKQNRSCAPEHPNFEALREYIQDYFALDPEVITALRRGRYAPTHSLAWNHQDDEYCSELDPLTLLHACGYIVRTGVETKSAAARTRYGFATGEVADELDYYLEHDCYGN